MKTEIRKNKRDEKSGEEERKERKRRAEQDVGINFINNIQLTNNKNTVYKRGGTFKPAVKEYSIYNASKKIADNNKKDIIARHNFSQTSSLNNNKINNSAKIFKRIFDYQDFSINSNKLLLTFVFAIMFFSLISMPFAEAAPADPGHGAAFILGGQNKNE